MCGCVCVCVCVCGYVGCVGVCGGGVCRWVWVCVGMWVCGWRGCGGYVWGACVVRGVGECMCGVGVCVCVCVYVRERGVCEGEGCMSVCVH